MSIDAVGRSGAPDLISLETRQQIAYTLAAKQLDVLKGQGDAMVQLIEAARGKSPGLGSRFDAQA